MGNCERSCVKVNRREITRMLMTILMATLLLLGAAVAEPIPAGDEELQLVTEEELARLEQLQTMSREAAGAVVPEEDPGMAIETPFITLYYPTEYAQQATVDVVKSGSSCTISVLANIDGTKLKLFSLTLSKTASNGYKLGKLGDAGVYVLMNEQQAADWSQKGFQKINELQESVNALLMQIYECENFAAGS